MSFSSRSAAQRLGACLGLVLAGCSLAAVVRSPDAEAASRSCGVIRSHGAQVHVRIQRGAVPCRRARRVLRAYLNSDRPCAGSSCVRIHRGFTCQAAPVFAFPRLASCWRGRQRIAAYSTAD